MKLRNLTRRVGASDRERGAVALTFCGADRSLTHGPGASKTACYNFFLMCRSYTTPFTTVLNARLRLFSHEAK
jgi:hypothetical protein